MSHDRQRQPRGHRAATAAVLVAVIAITSACGDATSTTSTGAGGGPTTIEEWAEGFCGVVLTYKATDLDNPPTIEPAIAVYHTALVELGPPPGADQATNDLFNQLAERAAYIVPVTTTTQPGLVITNYNRDAEVRGHWGGVLSSTWSFYKDATIDALRPNSDAYPEPPFESPCEELQSLWNRPETVVTLGP